MGRKIKYSKEVKIQACKDYLSGRKSAKEIANGIDFKIESLNDRIVEWSKLYEEYGPSIFDEKKRNSTYDEEFKHKLVKDYLSGKGSLQDLQIKYKIPSTYTIRQWILKYNKGEELKEYNPKGEVYTMKTRKVTREEKLEIIQYVLANNNDYKGAADRYTVPYHDVYNWVRKYLKTGEESVKDNRGRPPKNKPEVELSEEDKLKIELEKQKRINDRLALEIEILKKNIEIKKQLAKDFRK